MFLHLWSWLQTDRTPHFFFSPLFSFFLAPLLLKFLTFYALCFPFSLIINLSFSSFISLPLSFFLLLLFFPSPHFPFLLSFFPPKLLNSFPFVLLHYTLLSFSPSFFPPFPHSMSLLLHSTLSSTCFCYEHVGGRVFHPRDILGYIESTLQPHHHRYSCFGVWSGHGSDLAHKCSHCVQLPGSKVIMLIDLLASRWRVFLASLLSHKMALILLLYGDGWWV